MLIILHGNGLSAISQKISQIKKEYDPMSISSYSGKAINLENVLPIISTPSLFSEKRLVVLEDYDDKIDLEKLPNDPDVTIVLKFNKTLTAASKLLKTAQSLKAQVILLTEKDEVEIFPFLDLLSDQNPRSYQVLDKILDEKGGQYLLTMIFFMLRRLVNPPKNLPPFVIKKIAVQQSKLPQSVIKRLYKLALETDFKIKSGLMEERLGLTLLVEKIITAKT
jgi:DNA polymerase III delta subunit